MALYQHIEPIKAVQFTGKNHKEILCFCGECILDEDNQLFLINDICDVLICATNYVVNDSQFVVMGQQEFENTYTDWIESESGTVTDFGTKQPATFNPS